MHLPHRRGRSQALDGGFGGLGILGYRGRVLPFAFQIMLAPESNCSFPAPFALATLVSSSFFYCSIAFAV